MRPRSQSQPGTVACQIPALRPADYSPGRGASSQGVLPGLRGVTSRWVDLKLAVIHIALRHPQSIKSPNPKSSAEKQDTCELFGAGRLSSSLIHGPVPGWKTQHCFRSRAARDADCCKNNCVPYSIFFGPSEHRRGLWQGDPGKSPSRAAVWYWRPRRVLQEHLRTLSNFFPRDCSAEYPAARRHPMPALL